MPAEAIVLARGQHVAGVGVRRGHDVAVDVHATLGDAGRARRVGDHGDVVAIGLDGGEPLRLPRHHGVQRGITGPMLAGYDQALEHRRRRPRTLQLLPQRAPHDRRACPRVGDDVG
jgi:hypothetical protein